MTDEIELLRSMRPSPAEPDRVFVANERNALMAAIADARPTSVGDRPPPPGRRRRRSRWLIPVLVAASSATAAAGWAVLRPDPTTTTSVSCSDSVIDSSSGDPVADCAALWERERGAPAPPLAAYVGPGGGVLVIPVGENPPEGSAPLAAGFRQEAALIELESELGDVSRGLASRCMDESEARALTTRQLQRLALTDWTITVRAVEGPTPELCGSAGTTYLAIVDPGTRGLELVANLQGLAPAEAPYTKLAHRLTDLLVEGAEARCLPVEQAADLARQEATRLGFSEEQNGIVFHEVPPTDPNTPTCARPTTTVAGTVEVTIRAVLR